MAFKAPCDCNAVAGLKAYFPNDKGVATSQVFLFADAHGNNLTGIGHLFTAGAIVKVILHVDEGKAYIQNADTNAYLEGKFEGKADLVGGKVPAEQLPAMNYIPTTEKGVASGVATLGEDGKVSTGQLPTMGYSKGETLSNETKVLFGLGADAVPNDAFGVLSRLHSGLCNEHVWAKMEDQEEDVIVKASSTSNVTFAANGQDTVFYTTAEIVDGAIVLSGKRTGSYSSGINCYISKSGVYYYLVEYSSYSSPNVTYKARKLSVGKETVSHMVGFVNSSNSEAYPPAVADGFDYAYLGEIGRSMKGAHGSYVGTGTFGEASPNVLTFDFEPSVLVVRSVIESYSSKWMLAIRGQNQISLFNATTNSVAAICAVQWDGRTVSWFSIGGNSASNVTASAGAQMNGSTTYYYWAY